MRLDILLEDPFRPFLVIFNDPYPKTGKPSERLVYRIVDPRAIKIIQQEDGLHYSIGLAYNQRKGVEDVYRSALIHKVLLNYWTIKRPTPDRDAWYTWTVIDSETDIL